MATIKNKIELDDQMTPVLQKMLKAMSSVVKAMESTDKASSKAFKQAEKDINQASNSLLKLHQTADGVPSKFQMIQQAATGAAGAIYTIKEAIQAVSKVANASDDLTLMNARLGLITDNVAGLEEKIYNTAQSSRGNFKSMAATVSSLGMQAGEAFNNSEDEILQFTDTLNKMFTVSGLDSTGISSVMYNLTQSLSSGQLLGQDYRILRQNAPKFRTALQDYYGVSATELQDMVSAGKVSAEDVKLAIFQAADEINEQFNKIPMTFAQAADKIKNTVDAYLIPINNKISEILNSSAVVAFIDGINTSIKFVLTTIDNLLTLIQTVMQALEPYLGWLQPVIEAISTAIGVVLVGALVMMAAMAVKAFITFAISVLAANVPLLIVIAAVAALIFIFKKLGIGVKDVMGFIMGVIYAAWAVIQNIGIGIYNGFLFVVDHIKDKWLKFVKDIVTLAQPLLDIIDFIFGTDFGSGARNFTAKMEYEIAKTPEYKEYKSVGDAYGKGKDAGEKLYAKVESIGDNLSGVMSGKGMAVSGINDTVTTKGEMSISEDDLKLLKDISATEFVNRFTTLRPTLNASFGDVTQNADVDVIMDKIGDMMEEALAESLY